MKAYICSLIKNEHLYLEEWILYHLNLGFAQIHLVEDYGSKSHKEITDKFDNVFLYTIKELNIQDTYLTDKSTSTKQTNVFNWALHQFKGKADWLLCNDVDEFVYIDEGLTLQRILEDFNEYPGIYLYWRMFGADGRIHRPNIPTVEAYVLQLHCENKRIGCDIKSFINLNLISEGEYISAHMTNCFLVNTYKLFTSVFKSYDKICLNHYFTKSLEDWIYRFKYKGDLLKGNRKFEMFFKLNPKLHYLKKKVLRNEKI